MIKKLYASFFLLSVLFVPLEAHSPLLNLTGYDKKSCLELLEQAKLHELWDAFLQGQADLYFDQEAAFIAKERGWEQAVSVLEIGSGNGAYLNKLFMQFREKAYLGIEKQPELVLQSTQRFAMEGLSFVEGNVEIKDEALDGKFDVVLFRLTLQHLKEPRLALMHAYHYLKPEGHVIIIDACDRAKRCSHKLPALENAFHLLNEKNQKTSAGNREITMEILGELQKGKGHLAAAYDIAFSSLNTEGAIVHEWMKFDGKNHGKLLFNHGLLILNLLHKSYEIPVEFEQAYDELNICLDEGYWVTPGIHFLVLKKKS
ncbi:MAG: methyltransferase domain-containing protein [Chlamydiota bacterium]